MQFWCPSRFRIYKNKKYNLFYEKILNFNLLGVINNCARGDRQIYPQAEITTSRLNQPRGQFSDKRSNFLKTRQGSPLMTAPPPISSTALSGKKRKKKKLTRDTWHVTRDTWHVTRDTWHVTHDTLGGWTFSQNFSSLALTVCDLWYYEDILGKGWLNESINEWRGCL